MKATDRILCCILISLQITLFSWPASSQWQVSQSRIDSLQTALQNTSRNDSAIVPLLKSLSKVYIYKDAHLAIQYAREAVDLSDEFKMSLDPMIYVYMARAYARIPDNDTALFYFKTALAEASVQKDTADLAWIHSAIGFYYFNLRNVPAAVSEFEDEIKFGQALDDKKIIADGWFGKALTYDIFEEFESMFKALQQYLIFVDYQHEQRRIADAYRLMAMYYRSINQFQQAIDGNQQSFDMAASIGDSALMGAALNHMAWYYYEMGELDKSLKIYQKNISFYKPGGNNALANVYGNIGNIYRDWERYPEAINYYNKSIELSKVNNDIYNLSWLYEDISKMYERTGDYRQAYENQKLASIYGDSLLSANYQLTMAGARAQYEADKNAKELELLSMRLQRNHILVWSLVVGLGLIASVAILIISRFRFKSRQRMEAMNHTISELNQTNLRQQMNPHFIFNTLNAIQYYVFQNDKISSNNYMTKFASLIRRTLENSRHTEISIKEELDALHLYLELEELRFKEKFDWTIRVDEEIDTLAYKIPTMLIQPYVENAITHGLMNKDDGKGILLVELQLQDDQILCTIEDNGIGRAKAREIRQKKNSQHQSMGTNITESRLKLVNELFGKSMKVGYTDLMDEAGEPVGTKVEINIPIIT